MITRSRTRTSLKSFCSTSTAPQLQSSTTRPWTPSAPSRFPTRGKPTFNKGSTSGCVFPCPGGYHQSQVILTSSSLPTHTGRFRNPMALAPRRTTHEWETTSATYHNPPIGDCHSRIPVGGEIPIRSGQPDGFPVVPAWIRQRDSFRRSARSEPSWPGSFRRRPRFSAPDRLVLQTLPATDLLDIHFIGHSRGAELNNLALQALGTVDMPQLRRLYASDDAGPSSGRYLHPSLGQCTRWSGWMADSVRFGLCSGLDVATRKCPCPQTQTRARTTTRILPGSSHPTFSPSSTFGASPR